MAHEKPTSLIPFVQRTIGTASIPTVDARDLYAFLGPKSRFNDWITRRIQQYGFAEERDFTVLKTEYGTISSQAEYLGGRSEGGHRLAGYARDDLA